MTFTLLTGETLNKSANQLQFVKTVVVREQAFLNTGLCMVRAAWRLGDTACRPATHQQGGVAVWQCSGSRGFPVPAPAAAAAHLYCAITVLQHVTGEFY